MLLSTTRNKLTTITPSVLIERARMMAMDLSSRATEIDNASKLPDDLIAQWIDLGLIATLVPKKYGGHEFGLDTAAKIVTCVAAVCPSAAWVLAFYIGHNWIHCQFPESAQLEIFAKGPSPLSAGVLAPLFKLQPVEGGYRVSGRNSWNSGSPHAEWIMSGGMTSNGSSPPSPVIFVIPRSDVTLIDTWNMEGMRATGSWDVVLNDVFIPEHRIVPAEALLNGSTPGSAVHCNPFYARPLVLLTFAYCVPVFVGALRGVADKYVEVTRTRVGTNDGKSAIAKPVAQMRAGYGEARTALAEIMLDELITSIMAPTAAEQFDVEGRLALRARVAMIVDFCRQTVGELVLGAGANAFRKESKLQMIFRDINMISTHAFFDREVATETLGSVLLGLEHRGPI